MDAVTALVYASMVHPLVLKSRNQGKAARMLANKIALAIKVDLYKGKFIGDKLKKDLEKKLR